MYNYKDRLSFENIWTTTLYLFFFRDGFDQGTMFFRKSKQASISADELNEKIGEIIGYNYLSWNFWAIYFIGNYIMIFNVKYMLGWHASYLNNNKNILFFVIYCHVRVSESRENE